MAQSYYICLDIGGTKILGAIFNMKKEIVYRLKKKTKADGDSVQNVEDTIISVVSEMIEEFGISTSQIKAIAAGAPGVIDQEKGIVLTSPNLPWKNYNIKKPIEKKFGAPFYIGNDVNVGVLGEHRYGVAKGYKNVVGLFVGTGMGGGLILNNELYTGHLFKGAEFGHMILIPDGPKCNCGQRGCLEALSSKQGISDFIRTQAARGRETTMAEAVQNGNPIIACVSDGDFTDGGHFIVLTGYKDGKFSVNDPNSYINTEKWWDYDRLEGQIDGLWAFYRDESLTTEDYTAQNKMTEEASTSTGTEDEESVTEEDE